MRGPADNLAMTYQEILTVTNAAAFRTQVLGALRACEA